MHLIDVLETQVDWNKFFGVVDDLYNDPGFTTNADNFIISSTVELALSEFSPLIRVDQNGYDFLIENTESDYTVSHNNINGEPIELKMMKNLFGYKKNPHKTKPVKMKNFRGEKRTVEDFKKETTFSQLVILDLTNREVIVVEDEVAREKYYHAGDGVCAQFDLGDYYKCDIGEVNPVRSTVQFSDILNNLKKEFINNRQEIIK